MATGRKRKRVRRALGGEIADDTPQVPQDVEILAMTDTGTPPPVDMAEGAIDIPHEDGTVTIQFAPPPAPRKPSKFEDNLAEELHETNPFELGRIAEHLLEAIQQDESDRAEWLQQRSDGLDLLGQKVERPGTGNVGAAATAVAGQSTVRDSILSEACDQFQANAFAELCPAEGPCKVVNYGTQTGDTDQLATELEKDFNYYLTTIDKNYYPDTRKMLWWVGYASGMFKKVYWHPLLRRPVSESIDGADLIVPSNATSLQTAGRITHRINMRHSVMRRMQLYGQYRDVPLTQPFEQPNALQAKLGDVTGLNATQYRPEDQEYTIYEVYCELDIPGYEHKEEGETEPSGLPLPYKVTIDKDSRTVLEIRRNWREDDKDYRAKIPFVAFTYATGLGFYGTGLLHRLGNYAMALTAMLRECIDAGMFASFPGFLYAKPAGRQLQNEFRVPPGGGAPIDVSAVGNDIGKAVMALPYKDVSTAMVALMEQTRQNASRYASMANIGVGEGKQDAPVGTTLALIEQATKIEGSVHKALHAAQAEELQLLAEEFRKDPASLWRGNKRPAMGKDLTARMQRFQQALEDCEIVPASDPNVPSNMHRLAKATALLQTAMGAPQVFKPHETVIRWAKMARIDDIESLLAPILPPQAPQPDPVDMAKLAIDKQKADTAQFKAIADVQHKTAQLQSNEQIQAAKLAMGEKPEAGTPQPDPFEQQHRVAELDLKQQAQDLSAAKMVIDAHNKQADRDSREAVEAFKLVQTSGVHPEATPVMDQQLAKVSDFLEPAARKNVADGGVVQGAWTDGLDDMFEPDLPPDAFDRQLAISEALALMRALQRPQS